jgi:hypothetical protein
MKERPILFSVEMVRAILEGRKSMTRRVVKPQPYLLYRPETYKTKVDNWGQCAWIDEEGYCEHIRGHDHPAYTVCPYGMIGDRLWVREKWRPLFDDPDSTSHFGLGDCIQYAADMKKHKPSGLDEKTGYRFDVMCEFGNENPNWKPSIFMPRWASRITLEMTGVRVERLQEITETDALREGIFEFNGLGFYGYDKTGTPGLHCCDSARETFRCLWEKINGRESLDKNPWVWVVEFKTLDSHALAGAGERVNGKS